MGCLFDNNLILLHSSNVYHFAESIERVDSEALAKMAKNELRVCSTRSGKPADKHIWKCQDVRIYNIVIITHAQQLKFEQLPQKA